MRSHPALPGEDRFGRKYSVLPHITDKHMRFSPPPANTSGGYTLI